jgi:hypothetical protein
MPCFSSRKSSSGSFSHGKPPLSYILHQQPARNLIELFIEQPAVPPSLPPLQGSSVPHRQDRFYGLVGRSSD